MILGIGSDIVDMRRIKKTLARFGTRFTSRCFDPLEIAKAESRRGGGTHIATYARRFAAKEAASKALGTGFTHGVAMRDIVVTNDKTGKPSLQLKNGALQRLQDITPSGKTAAIHVSLTDEPPLAQAYVIIEII